MSINVRHQSRSKVRCYSMVVDFNNSIKTGQEYSLEFQVTESMINDFAQLTGDFSSIHVDQTFARKMLYRKNVAHGLLSVAYISMLDVLCIDNFPCIIKKISTLFLNPVFAKDRLELNSRILELHLDKQTMQLDYSIKNVNSHQEIITGKILLSIFDDSRKEIPSESAVSLESKKLILEDLKESTFELKDINERVKRDFNFNLTLESSRKLFDILSEGIIETVTFPKWQRGCDKLNILSTMLLSPFAGMCIPGRYATIISIEMVFNQNTQWNKLYKLGGQVTFKSSVGVISNSIVIKDSETNDEPIAEGKMDIQVNSPPKRMPGIEDLRNNSMDLLLKDKVVLITGASRGIGETCAKIFSLHGSKVVVNFSKGEEDAKRVVSEITKSSGTAICVQADVSDSKQVNRMVESIIKKYQKIDILVNNAVGNFIAKEFMNLTWNEMQNDLDIIVKGSFNCCQGVIPLMIENGGGKIINISTVATDIPPKHQTKYVVAKSGLVGLTRSLAVELSAKNIQVNMVVPNMVETDLISAIPKMGLKTVVQKSPMKRLATPVDVSRAVVFLASSMSSYTTGQKIMVTGGEAPFL